MFVVVHSSPDSPAMLASLLNTAGPLPASYPRNGESFRRGHIYVAPPDRHLLLYDGRVHVTRGPRENGFRPAVDPLFRTAAEQHGARVIGIVLSGALDDGTLGLDQIKRHGGIAIAQDVDEALVQSMPLSAIRNVEVDLILKAAAMAPVIARLSKTKTAGKGAGRKRKEKTDTAERGARDLRRGILRGQLSQFTCPECGGALSETRTQRTDEFQCHVGHRYNSESLANAQDGRLESAMWTAFRTLEETAAFQRHLVERARDRGLHAIAAGHERRARNAEANAAVLQSVLTDVSTPLTGSDISVDKKSKPRARRAKRSDKKQPG